MTPDIEDAVKSTISRRLEVEDAALNLDADLFDDLGADVGEAATVLLELEDLFEVEIDEMHAEGLRTVGDVVRCLCAVLHRT